MLKKIKEICLSLGVFSILAVPLLAPAAVYAEFTTDDIQGSACNGSTGIAEGSANTSNCAAEGGGSGLESILKKVIQIFSIIVGFVAVVMIIVGGIRYITSGGDSGNISGAKNTIIYAIIGLIIVALAQVLVHFVLNNINAASNG
jgi:hypothetical protein